MFILAGRQTGYLVCPFSEQWTARVWLETCVTTNLNAISIVYCVWTATIVSQVSLFWETVEQNLWEMEVSGKYIKYCPPKQTSIWSICLKLHNIWNICSTIPGIVKMFLYKHTPVSDLFIKLISIVYITDYNILLLFSRCEIVVMQYLKEFISLWNYFLIYFKKGICDCVFSAYISKIYFCFNNFIAFSRKYRSTVSPTQGLYQAVKNIQSSIGNKVVSRDMWN